MVLDEVESWEEAIKISGSLLVDNMYVKTEYIDEMINLVKKYGSYIVIDDGIALPHAGISRNVLKLGVGVLVVKKPVLFSDKKSANIFISFASNENKSHLTILNDLFDLITKYDLKGELLQAKDKHEVIDYFIKTKVYSRYKSIYFLIIHKIWIRNFREIAVVIYGTSMAAVL